MKTIDSILDNMQKAVEEDRPVSPSQWVESAIRINALKGTLDNQIAEFEGNLALLEADLIGNGESAASAKAKARGLVQYTEYLKARAKSKRIDEFVRLAKKRASINEF